MIHVTFSIVLMHDTGDFEYWCKLDTMPFSDCDRYHTKQLYTSELRSQNRCETVCC